MNNTRKITMIAAFTLGAMLTNPQPALAVHECPEAGTQEECDVCTELATEMCFEDAGDTFNECATFYADTPFLIDIICTPELSNDNSDCTQHIGEFDFDATVVALLDLGECSAGGTMESECPCNDPWANHGEYVSCVAQAAGDLGMTNAKRKDTVKAAARSLCGRG